MYSSPCTARTHWLVSRSLLGRSKSAPCASVGPRVSLTHPDDLPSKPRQSSARDQNLDLRSALRNHHQLNSVGRRPKPRHSPLFQVQVLALLFQRVEDGLISRVPFFLALRISRRCLSQPASAAEQGRRTHDDRPVAHTLSEGAPQPLQRRYISSSLFQRLSLQSSPHVPPHSAPLLPNWPPHSAERHSAPP